MNGQRNPTPDQEQLLAAIARGDRRRIARAISLVEDGGPEAEAILAGLDPAAFEQTLVVGITGPPGAGKSTLTSRLVGALLAEGPGPIDDETDDGQAAEGADGGSGGGQPADAARISGALPEADATAVAAPARFELGVIAVDPSSSLSGGAILGDRIRMMEHAGDPRVLVRSMASRGRGGGLGGATGSVARLMAAAGCRTVLIETVGVGQAELDIVAMADLTLLVLAPGLGDEVQAMKAGLLEVADLLVVNKADLPGAPALALDLESVARSRRDPAKPARMAALPEFSEASENSAPPEFLESSGTASLPPAESASPEGPRAAEPRAAEPPPVLLVTATTGQGVAELVGQLRRRHQALRAGGQQAARRRAARRQEVVEWALALLRPRLLAVLAQAEDEPAGDPRQRARELLQRWKTTVDLV